MAKIKGGDWLEKTAPKSGGGGPTNPYAISAGSGGRGGNPPVNIPTGSLDPRGSSTPMNITVNGQPNNPYLSNPDPNKIKLNQDTNNGRLNVPTNLGGQIQAGLRMVSSPPPNFDYGKFLMQLLSPTAGYGQINNPTSALMQGFSPTYFTPYTQVIQQPSYISNVERRANSGEQSHLRYSVNKPAGQKSIWIPNDNPLNYIVPGDQVGAFMGWPEGGGGGGGYGGYWYGGGGGGGGGWDYPTQAPSDWFQQLMNWSI